MKTLTLTTLLLTTASLLAPTLAMPQGMPNNPTGQPTCPRCDPLPEQNKCDTTTSCIYIWGHNGPNGPNYCACRAGYKADPRPDGRFVQQFRLPWATQEGRVFVEPGAVCNTLCDQWYLGKDGCQEVPLEPMCL